MTSLRPFTVLALALGLAACGNDAPPPPPTPVVPPVVPVQPVAGPAAQPGVVPPGPGTVVPPGPGAVPPAGQIPSNFGTLMVNPGFAPDPMTAQGTSGGAVQASTFNASCLGWVSQMPDHVLMLGGTFPLLRIMVNGGEQDTTLVVQRPDGQYVCNDDSEGRNPIVAASFGPGAHRVWVGSYSQGTTAPYRLGVSANPASMASALGAPPSTGTTATALNIQPNDWSSNFGTITLTPGFTPDPHRVTGTSGGGLNASTVAPGCNGWIATRPDHVLTAAGNFSSLRVMVKSTSDTTIVVQKPDGTWLCNDDTEDRNPVVAGPFPTGNYRIWVGSYTQNEQAGYTLGLSELISVTPRSL